MATIKIFRGKNSTAGLAELEVEVQTYLDGLAGGTAVGPIQVNPTDEDEIIVGIAVGDGADGLNATGGVKVRSVDDDDYAMLPQDTLVHVINKTAGRAVTLPELASITTGKVVYVVDADGGAGANAITVNPHTGGELINGGASATISTNYLGVAFYYTGITGSEWVTLP